MPPQSVNRRTALVAGGAAALGAINAFAIEPHWLDVTRHRVPIEGLASSLEGYSIAQITDAHLTTLGRVEETILSVVTKAQPQAIVLTGDIIDSPANLECLKSLCSELARSGARLIATLGNWEHWGDINLGDLRSRYRDVGAQLLVNESLALGGVTYQGTDDSTGGSPRVTQERVANARVLLTHSPAYLDEAPPLEHPFDLALSGHTHGGQIRLTSRAVPYVPPGSGRFTAGWYDTPCGKAYVSRGTGTSIVPVRFTCRPELPVFTLVRG